MNILKLRLNARRSVSLGFIGGGALLCFIGVGTAHSFSSEVSSFLYTGSSPRPAVWLMLIGAILFCAGLLEAWSRVNSTASYLLKNPLIFLVTTVLGAGLSLADDADDAAPLVLICFMASLALFVVSLLQSGETRPEPTGRFKLWGSFDHSPADPDRSEAPGAPNPPADRPLIAAAIPPKPDDSLAV